MVTEFATIVGLLSAFTSGRTGSQQLNYSEFIAWLTEHNHEEVIEMIEANQSTITGIQTVLDKGLTDIRETLVDISKRLALLATRSEGVRALAIASADELISEQSIEILTLMDHHQTEFFVVSKGCDNQRTALIMSQGDNYVCTESQFIEDDLDMMIKLGLLVVRHNSSGEKLYHYTRAASKLISSIA